MGLDGIPDRVPDKDHGAEDACLKYVGGDRADALAAIKHVIDVTLMNPTVSLSVPRRKAAAYECFKFCATSS